MPWNVMQCNTLKCNTILRPTIPCNTLLYNARTPNHQKSDMSECVCVRLCVKSCFGPHDPWRLLVFKVFTLVVRKRYRTNNIKNIFTTKKWFSHWSFLDTGGFRCIICTNSIANTHIESPSQVQKCCTFGHRIKFLHGSPHVVDSVE